MIDLFDDDIWSANADFAFDLEQALISKKKESNSFSVERDFINSKAFHDKFERMYGSREVAQSLYIHTGALLEHVDGKKEEFLIAINARTGEYLTDNFKRSGSIRGTGFTEKEYEPIIKCKNFVMYIHNHSLNGRPSAADLLTFLNNNKLKYSLIACHDGTLYGIYDVKREFEQVYNEYLENEKEKTSDIEEAKSLAMTKIYRLNSLLPDNKKLFDIRRF